MASNGDGKWFARLSVGAMFTTLIFLGLALWNVSAKADEDQRIDIKIIETRIENKLETKESHDKDIVHIKEKFEFIAQQLAEIRKAVEN